MSQGLWLCCWDKHESPRQLLHDCWWTVVLWVVRWLIVVFDDNSCGYSVGIDDRSWLIVDFDDNSCWAAVKNDWKLTGVAWLMGTGGCQLQLVWGRVDDGDRRLILILLSLSRGSVATILDVRNLHIAVRCLFNNSKIAKQQKKKTTIKAQNTTNMQW